MTWFDAFLIALMLFGCAIAAVAGYILFYFFAFWFVEGEWGWKQNLVRLFVFLTLLTLLVKGCS